MYILFNSIQVAKVLVKYKDDDTETFTSPKKSSTPTTPRSPRTPPAGSSTPLATPQKRTTYTPEKRKVPVVNLEEEEEEEEEEEVKVEGEQIKVKVEGEQIKVEVELVSPYNSEPSSPEEIRDIHNMPNPQGETWVAEIHTDIPLSAFALLAPKLPIYRPIAGPSTGWDADTREPESHFVSIHNSYFMPYFNWFSPNVTVHIA